MNAYDQLVATSGPLIKYYRDDLWVHDKRAIESHGEETPFLHWTRETGTHVLFLIPADKFPCKGESVPYLFGHADRGHILNETGSMIKSCQEQMNCLLIQYWNGKTLRTITAREAESIGEQYRLEIRRQWKQAERELQQQGKYGN